MSNGRARQLFNEYRALLDAEFSDDAATDVVGQRLMKIEEELARDDFRILRVTERVSIVRDKDKSPEPTHIFHHRLWLLPLPPADQIFLVRSEAVTKIGRVEVAALPITEQDRKFLKGVRLRFPGE